MREENSKRPKIDIGCRVGQLTVEAPTDARKNGYTVWRCRCDCGGLIMLDTRSLQRGAVRDCGCLAKPKPGCRDITGLRFGKLTAEYPVEGGKYGRTLWHCRCDCGGEVDAPLQQLTAGYRKSCGCLSHPPVKDYRGRRFGMLTVLDYAGKWDGLHRWRCQCDCGRETVVGQTALQSGHTKSCGCLQAETVFDNMRFIDGTSVTSLEKAGDRLISSNTSGHNGVYQNKASGKWVAQITFKGKTYYLGSFAKIEDAALERKKAEDRIYGEFLDWYYETHPGKRKST